MKLFRLFFTALPVVLLFAAPVSCVRSKPAAPAVFPPDAPPGGGEGAGGEALPDLAETLARLSAALEAGEAPEENIHAGFAGALAGALDNAEIPESLSRRIRESVMDNPGFILDLLICLEGDRELRRLVDKEHALPPGYAPEDLVPLRNGAYRTGRAGLTLRAAAADSLDEMAAAAKTAGVTLTASSAYRSYDYQVEVYDRIVRQMGREAAERESARPGHSQHQTGLTVDFGSIDDSFAETAAGRWMAANASRFGWSLSFPRGYEALTGYRWESWHYRYVGRDLAAFIGNYFDGIQQYALRFIHELEAVSTP
jgi:D-alanyl-D-alanine carboxypeptidase